MATCEYELYSVLPMSDEELDKAAIQHKGKYNHWTGALQHIAVWSRQDINHAVMRLSGYNAAPSLPCWKVLDQLMRYLYHHPHVWCYFWHYALVIYTGKIICLIYFPVTSLKQ